LGHGWTTFLHPDDLALARQTWERVRSGNEAWQVDYRLRGADGGYRWFNARAVPQLDADGRVLRWFGTTSDIEESRAAAQMLQEADRQKDEFLATLAHELRNPLAPIRTAVQLLASPALTPEARERATAVIGRQVGHMAHLLDDLIDIARITRHRLDLKKERMSVDELVETAMETARPLAASKRQALGVTVASAGLQLVADPVRLAQILSNLLNNASKYTDMGGHIMLDVRLEGDAVVFSVTDSGIGMSEAAIGNIFTMFAQEQAAASAGPPGHARTVLLADDNRDAVQVLAELLRLDGHTVYTANDGLQAMALAGQLQPDVLVLDIGMPGRNGYEVARHVRAQPWRSRPLVIAATGWGQEDDRQKALAAGFDLHLTKPFDPLELSAVIRQRVV